MTPVACLFPWTHMYYHSDKNVYPCCKLAGVEKFKLGNSSDTVESLWNSKVLKQLRKDIINKTEPPECHYHCFNNINPLHLYLPEEYRAKQEEYFLQTAEDGHHNNSSNFVIWNINESNICNFKCVYCCSEFSNQFDKTSPIRKSFDNVDSMLQLFEQNIPTIEKLFLSSGESHMQAGYYKMLELLIKNNKTNIEINVHTNMSGYKFGKKNFFELLNNFSNVTVFGSLDSYGERAEYIRNGTCWKTIENTRKVLQQYKNIHFVIQAVITNLNLWSLPDFHQQWYEKGLVGKEDIRYFCLTSPEYLHISVLENSMKQKIEKKYIKYLDFLKDITSTKYNTMTPYDKVSQILDCMKKEPVVSPSFLNFNLFKKDLQNKLKFRNVFPEFVT
jgi:radical SAM protein with 4Fe4S-binding SPASM domain